MTACGPCRAAAVRSLFAAIALAAKSLIQAASESGWSFITQKPASASRRGTAVVSSQPSRLSVAPGVAPDGHTRLVITIRTGILSALASLLPSLKKPSRMNAFTVAGEVCVNMA